MLLTEKFDDTVREMIAEKLKQIPKFTVSIGNRKVVVIKKGSGPD